MKKLLFLSLMMSILLVTSAQTTPKKITPDPMLYEVYTAEKINAYMDYSPEKIVELNYYAQNFCYVSKEKPSNAKEMGDISDVKRPNMEIDIQSIIVKKKINSLLYNLQQGITEYHVYDIGTTGWYVIVYPENIFLERKNEYTKQYIK